MPWLSSVGVRQRHEQVTIKITFMTSLNFVNNLKPISFNDLLGTKKVKNKTKILIGLFVFFLLR